MDANTLKLVKSCKLFSSLDESILKDLIKNFHEVSLKKHQALFHQGEIADSLYLLISGKLLVNIKAEKNTKKIISEVNPGETIGELGALSHEPRTATVTAFEESFLLRLSGEDFYKLIQTVPTVAQQTFDILINRSHNLIQMLSSEDPFRRHIVFIPANNTVSLVEFYEKITELVKKIDGISIFHDKELTTDSQNEIDRLDQQRQLILYFLTAHDSSLAKISLARADIIYVVAKGETKPYINRSVLQRLVKPESYHEAKPDLILLHQKENTLPRHTMRWLKLANFGFHHHIRIAQTPDWARLLRFIQGKAVGLVLGGGGLRSWAHLGAIRALIKANVPIDMIGGTSAGAIVAGYYAMHEYDPKNIQGLRELSTATRKAVHLRNLTWPAVSLFNSKDYTETLFKLFGNVRLEDLWLPCFIVTTNLSDYTQMIYRKGRLWKTIRSSTAVPAIFPPVVIKGKIHMDGGILNNLPVDVMRKMIGSRGTIVAVELTKTNENKKAYYFPTVLTFWQTLLAKLHIIHKDYRFPNFIDTFLKALLAGAYAEQQVNGTKADFLITPDLTKYGLLNVKPKQENELIRIGYRATRRAMRKRSKQSAKETEDQGLTLS